MVRLKNVRNVLLYTLFFNMLVAVAKIVYAYKTNSISMLSDGFHSFFDGTSNIIGLIGIFIASQPPDERHPYGHRKFETLSTIAIVVLIFFAGFGILKKAFFSLRAPHNIEVTSLSFIIMGLTLLINVGVMTYEKRKGVELKSDFLLADAMHTNSDIFVSISVIISLIAAKIGYSIIDSITAVVIAILIGKMGVEILKPAADVLTDAARIDTSEINKIVMTVKGIKGCHEIRTRGREDAVHIDLHVLIDPGAHTYEAHDLAHAVEDAIKERFPSAVDVVVHIEPYDF
ncbi:MAG: cation transporter [Nitrospirae bacterium]|nr:cation transporter [Nitrospirota bacterium]